jgi:hypothetical protein
LATPAFSSRSSMMLWRSNMLRVFQPQSYMIVPSMELTLSFRSPSTDRPAGFL